MGMLLAWHVTDFVLLCNHRYCWLVLFLPFYLLFIRYCFFVIILNFNKLIYNNILKSNSEFMDMLALNYSNLKFAAFNGEDVEPPAPTAEEYIRLHVEIMYLLKNATPALFVKSQEWSRRI